MTEHDAPTVACATIWLDTSQETPTRPAECVDELATTRVRRLQLRPPLGGSPSAPPHTLQTVAFERAPGEPASAPTMLDHSSVFATFEQSATADVAIGAAIKTQGLHIPLARGRSRAVQAGLGVVVVAAAFGVGRFAASTAVDRQAAKVVASELRRTEKLHPQPAPSPPRVLPEAVEADRARAATEDVVHEGAATEPTRDRAAPVPVPVPVGAPRASARQAVDALARGDYPRALEQYEALAAQRPNDAALAAVASVLRDRVGARCSRDDAAEGACGH